MGLTTDRLGGRGSQRLGSTGGMVESSGLGVDLGDGGASSLAVPWRDELALAYGERRREDVQWSPWGSQPTDSVGEGARASLSPASWS